MTTRYRVSEAAAVLGVSDDTVRRWGDSGRLTIERGDSGPLSVDGRELARVALELGEASELSSVFPTARASTRNRVTGIVTRVVRDGVMAQVELQAGPFRMVSLISREAADELELQPGVLAVATVKATNVAVELPDTPRRSES
ncbi:molybdopterin-binding protein [Schumannella sp. 10F1B-5-1]|uniref:TOBE domain-containing protein n=1 Tax=Schumannella sp. 10F1B-5-1 TaxID=2590780 RepID=UPI0011316EEF|nr:TOBE domain-containing protein [Schumannella sp. 10F1B-5-1]TPW72813.1 MerR family transcriptional regulator [Schumannella sp. 10F1B-5-1]